MGDLKLKVAVSTGLFGIAHPEDLATVVRKIGYGLTRGSSAIELAADVPHEVNYSEGYEVRYIAKKQDIDINFHGSLTIPFCIPEMVQWQEADDHVRKSIKSAVYSGSKYVNFHSCLHFWLEMMSYVGARLEIIMCDWDGEFISEILFKSQLLREYFLSVPDYWEKYSERILGEERNVVWYTAQHEASIGTKGNSTGKEFAKLQRKKYKKGIIEELKKKFTAKTKKERDWYWVGKKHGDYVDVCDFIINFLYFEQDPIWLEMVRIYKKVLQKYIEEFGSIDDPKNNIYWIRNAYEKANSDGDLKFKEFYYGVIGAKFLQGHLMAACRWMAETKGEGWNHEKRGLPTMIKNELKMIKPHNMEKEYKELMDVLKNLKIAIEMPDARDPREAGRYMLWKTKHIHVAIMQTRKELKKEGNPYWDKIFMLVDFEHIATQAIDPYEELIDLTNNFPDVGKYIICVHSNNPSPLHSHFPIQLGDDRIYRLLWILKEAGMGKDHTTYILFERGGFKDPFKHAVAALKIMVKFLKKDVPPDKLPPEFYGIHPRGLLSEERQWVTIFQHAMDPLKGTLRIPEEEYTFLGRAATEAGKRPEEWKKEEYR